MAQLTWNELKDNLRQKFPTVVITAEQLSECLQELDAVPVVRCKDCTSFYSGWCCDFGIPMDDNEFCSWGERREDETD